ncbi:MAG: type II toxin-antitoxin system YafQ family toxin [Calditrichaceae bacterium]|nr:type II toxin-antitoxin system YafQ family toxin [Calditrichaceae bacterium]
MKIQEGSYFRKDIKRMKQRGKSLTELKKAITLLANGQKLPGNYKDHPLGREWSEYRECHIKEDFLLIYKIAWARTPIYLSKTLSFQRSSTIFRAC